MSSCVQENCRKMSSCVKWLQENALCVRHCGKMPFGVRLRSIQENDMVCKTFQDNTNLCKKTAEKHQCMFKHCRKTPSCIWTLQENTITWKKHRRKRLWHVISLQKKNKKNYVYKKIAWKHNNIKEHWLQWNAWTPANIYFIHALLINTLKTSPK